MKMKRTLSAFALTATAAMLLAGCSPSSNNSIGGDKPADPAKDPCIVAEVKPMEALAASTPSTGAADQLQIGTLLPLTGSLGFLLPPVQAGVAQALADIEAAGGVLDKPVLVVAEGNEGDGSDMTVVEKGAADVIAKKPAFVLGAMSSSRTDHVVDKVVAEGILMGSPSNTATNLSGRSPLYFRTAPPDSVQGDALANQILQDGKQKIAYLTFNDSYGLGLRDTVQCVTEKGSATTVYGGKGEGNEFPVEQTSFASEVTAVKNAKPDAIVIVTFDQINSILPELLNQKIDLKNVYLVDGNTNNFAKVIDAGKAEGMQGSVPGAEANAEFKGQLESIYEKTYNKKLESLTYGPEAYDLVMIVSLAAEKAGKADSLSIQKELANVTGANGGDECKTFAECKTALKAGKSIKYVGKSGTGSMNKNNDPSSAFIGIYKYDKANAAQFVRSVEGTVK